MKPSFALATTAATLATAAPVVVLPPAESPFFSIIAARSTSYIHLESLSARDHQIWVGGNTSTFCPSTIAAQHGCPSTSHPFADFSVTNTTGQMYMGAVVPGGQQVYVDPACGAVKYTVAHSGAVPKGAVLDGWTLEAPGPNGLGVLKWRSGLLACNVTEGGPFGVFADLPGKTPPGTCLGFDAVTTNQSVAGAWQYS